MTDPSSPGGPGASTPPRGQPTKPGFRPAMWCAERPRWVVVVRTERAAIQPKLSQPFQGAPWVEVVVDRRQNERRQRRLAPDVDRRRLDRRGRRMAGARATGYRLGYQTEGFSVYEALGFTPVQCPDCHLTVWFEMARFAEPPARLELEVGHLWGKYSRHVVEMRAFTASGHPLLSSRLTSLGRDPTTWRVD